MCAQAITLGTDVLSDKCPPIMDPEKCNASYNFGTVEKEPRSAASSMNEKAPERKDSQIVLPLLG